ncbi:MAG TPA: CPBP family glutamic-type intramembrane protease [bacterium]|nr:CPBP family glutamic-type intramembrane protease [bacterium]
MLLPVAAMIIGLVLCHNIWIAIALYYGIIIFSLIAYRITGLPRQILRDINWRLTSFYSIITATNGILIYFMWPWIRKGEQSLHEVLTGYGLYEHQWILFILCYCFCTPVLEEYFWRELLGSQSKWPDLSDFLFAAYHVPVLYLFIKPIYILLIFIVLTGAALVWRQLKIKHCGLFIPIVSHFFADVSTIFAICFL